MNHPNMLKILITLILVCFQFFSSAQTGCEADILFGNNPEAGKLTNINGAALYYETYGSPKDQSLMIIHGNGGSIKDVSCQIAHFMQDHYVIVADSRAHGKSSNGNQPLTFAAMADDYSKLLEVLALDSVQVIGDSDGGIIGLILAMKYPKKVSKLVAVSPNIRSDSLAVHQWDITHLRDYLSYLRQEVTKEDVTNETKRKLLHMELLDKYPQMTNEELLAIHAPTLLISSDADVIRLEHTLDIYHHIPNAHLFIMPGSTHLLRTEKPTLFNQIVSEFLIKPFTRPTTRELFYGEQ